MASRSTNLLCNACFPFSEKSFYSTKPIPPGSNPVNQTWGKLESRRFSEVQKNAQCPLCRLVCKGLLQNRTSSNQLDNERIYYYRLLFGTFEFTEVDEFDPDHEYNDLELYGLDELNPKGKNKRTTSDAFDSDEMDDLEECTNPSATSSSATNLVLNKNPFRDLPGVNITSQVSKDHGKGILPLDQYVRSRMIRKDISRIPKPLDGDISKIRHDLGFWKLYQTSRLHISTNPIVLDKGGPEIARGMDALEAKVNGDADTDIILICDSGGRYGSKFENAFLQGRHTSLRLDFNLAKSWIKTCADAHEKTCSVTSLASDQYRGPSRLIDVQKQMVVSVHSPCPYVALSYRWADGQLMLQRDTYNRLTRPGGLDSRSNDVPLTIRDSILLCQRMSTQYLWVDALCIMQDDSSDKQDQIGKMDAIYISASFTIVAACDVDSRASLPGVRTGSRRNQNVEKIGGINLAVAQPNLTDALIDTQWHHRAWTFQEAVLSQRLLIFTDYGVYFQCKTALWYEDTQLETPTVSEYSINKVEIPKFAKPFWKEALPTTRDFWTYAQLVEDYTPREMTCQTDALNAFTGLMSSIESVLDTKFFQGLPIVFFHAALCFGFATRHDNLRRPGFPSWSWSGWNPVDGVDYQDGLFFGEETCVDCHHFFRLRSHPTLGMQLVPVGIQDRDASSRDFYQSPALSKTIIETLTNVELESVLIFEAYKGRLYLDITDDYNETKIYVSPPSSNNHKTYPIGHVGLPPSLRKGPPQYMDFITMCTDEEIPGIDNTLLYLVEKDYRGITYRINFTGVCTSTWKSVKTSLEVVYML